MLELSIHHFAKVWQAKLRDVPRMRSLPRCPLMGRNWRRATSPNIGWHIFCKEMAPRCGLVLPCTYETLQRCPGKACT